MSFVALVEISDHAEAAAAVFDESDGGSPSAESLDGGILVLELEILEESLLHWLERDSGKRGKGLSKRPTRKEAREVSRVVWSSSEIGTIRTHK